MNLKKKLIIAAVTPFAAVGAMSFTGLAIMAVEGLTETKTATTTTAQSSTSSGPKGWNANNSPVNPGGGKVYSTNANVAPRAGTPIASSIPAPQTRLNDANERRGSVRRQCHAAFKAGMYDPRSFRIEREWFNELPNDDGTGHIAYIADVSGTNGFGGRVRKNIACIADGSVITDYQF